MNIRPRFHVLLPPAAASSSLPGTHHTTPHRTARRDAIKIEFQIQTYVPNADKTHTLTRPWTRVEYGFSQLWGK